MEERTMDKLVNFKMDRDEHEVLRRFFGMRGLSFTKGCRLSLEYVLEKVRKGELVFTEEGLKVNEGGAMYDRLTEKVLCVDGGEGKRYGK